MIIKMGTALFILLSIFCTIHCKEKTNSKDKGPSITPCNDKMDRAELVHTAAQYFDVVGPKQWIPIADCMKKAVLKNDDLNQKELLMFDHSILNAAKELHKDNELEKLEKYSREVIHMLQTRLIPTAYDALLDYFYNGKLTEEKTRHIKKLITVYCKTLAFQLNFEGKETQEKIKTLEEAARMGPEVAAMMFRIKEQFFVVLDLNQKEMFDQSILNAAKELHMANELEKLRTNSLQVVDMLKIRLIPRVYHALRDYYNNGELKLEKTNNIKKLINVYFTTLAFQFHFVPKLPSNREAQEKIEKFREAAKMGPENVAMLIRIKWYWEQFFIALKERRTSPVFQKFFTSPEFERRNRFFDTEYPIDIYKKN